MSGLLFQEAQPAPVASPQRADVVCFVGFVRRRAGATVPVRAKAWLQDQGWRERGAPVADDDPLLHVPVPLDSFEAFDRLFAWEDRPALGSPDTFATWTGAAIRSFFRQGGARCFLVRAGDPLPYTTLAPDASLAERAAYHQSQRTQLAALLPGLAATGSRPAERADRSTWKGLGVLLGLDEAAFVAFPDLPECVADSALAPVGLAPLPPTPERFETCTPTLRLPPDEVRRLSASPACPVSGYLGWRLAVRHAALFLRTHRRDVQGLFALPLPAPDAAGPLAKNLDSPAHLLGLGAGRTLDAADGIASAFVQLVFPWVAAPGSDRLPGGFEPPDGVMAGVLARTIPELGAGHSVGRQRLRGVQRFFPILSDEVLRPGGPDGDPAAFLSRVSVLGSTPDGPQVLSDVTTSPSRAHRPACIGRLTAALLRTARGLGDLVTFEPAGEDLWQRIRSQLERLLNQFYAAGALAGRTAEEAYSVRCDATTTTPNDRDNGRVVVEVRFLPAHPVGEIVVVLALRESAVTALEPSA